jgi:hypothetical protein
VDRYPAHEEEAVQVAASCESLYEYLDDPARLGAHMSRRNWRTAGMRMDYALDPQRGQGVGARIGLRGALLGLRLAVDEVVVESEPPYRKSWETVGVPRLLVIGPYRMGFRIERGAPVNAVLTVFIDYQPKRKILSGLVRVYARWCVTSMASDARRHFAAAR